MAGSKYSMFIIPLINPAELFKSLYETNLNHIKKLREQEEARLADPNKGTYDKMVEGNSKVAIEKIKKKHSK